MAPPRTPGIALVASAGATVVHIALVAIAVFVGSHFARKAVQAPAVTQLVDVELPPKAPPTPDSPAPAPSPISKPIQHSAKPPMTEAPPAAAQAGEVLKASDDVVDFGEHFVEGNGPGYVGGVTDANGTSTQAQRDVSARGNGPPPIVVAAPEVDRSRHAQLAGGSAWDCPFPVEADDAGIDNAVVALRIEVAADGHVLSAIATRDPGHGFGREARRCALSKHWSAGLDRAGQPISSTTVVNVRFDR
jgi:protein TonB